MIGKAGWSGDGEEVAGREGRWGVRRESGQGAAADGADAAGACTVLGSWLCRPRLNSRGSV